MKRLFALCIVLIASMLLAGCRGSGSSAPPPSNVNVVAGDTSATVSWDMSPGVEYWLFYATASDVTPQSCTSSLTGCKIIMKAVSPIVISGLANGTTYSITLNGRINGGPGGAGSPSVQAIPRLAGAVWTPGSSMIPASDMHAVTYGNTFVAAGTTSSLFSSTDGITWTPQPAINWGTTTPSLLPDLNAATYFNTNYLTVGAGGVILTSPDAVTWTSQTSGTVANLFAVTSNGSGGYVATGTAGTIITSGNAINWTAATNNAGTTTALYGVTYGNGMYVAVGQTGTIITSADNGVTWNSIAAPTPNDLKCVAYGIVNGAGIFVALGNNGALVTSTDGVTWTASPTLSATQINAVTFGRQFIAVDNSGGTFTSPDGLIWTRTQTATSALFAVTHGPFDYSAVGVGGANFHSM